MNNNQSTNEWSKRDIGALWKREGQSQKYLSGYVKVDELGIEKEVKIVVFSNKNKNNNEKAPDYRIYISKPADASKADRTTAVESKAVATKKIVATKKPKVEDIVEENEADLL
jgi:uncharacterized protein (DUF736 family)